MCSAPISSKWEFWITELLTLSGHSCEKMPSPPGWLTAGLRLSSFILVQMLIRSIPEERGVSISILIVEVIAASIVTTVVQHSLCVLPN